MRRDHASTPPKPESEMRAKATNRSSSAGVGADGVGGGGSEAAESVSGMVRKVKPRPAAGTKRFVGSTAMSRHASSRGAADFHPAVARSFFARPQGLYWWVPARAGYGDKWPSQ